MQPINSRSTVKVVCQSGTRHLFGFILRLLIHFVRMSDLSYFSWFFMNSLVPCLTRFNAAVNYLVIGLHFCSNSSAPVQSLLTHCLRKSMLFSNFSLFFSLVCCKQESILSQKIDSYSQIFLFCNRWYLNSKYKIVDTLENCNRLRYDKTKFCEIAKLRKMMKIWSNLQFFNLESTQLCPITVTVEIILFFFL